MAGLMKRTIIAGALIVVAAGTSGAQQIAAGPKWQAWIGCWIATPTSAGSPSVCITPTSSTGMVTVTTIADSKVLSRDTIDASGRERPITAKDCSGTQLGNWSADERRLYLRSSVTCESTRSSTSTIFAMTATGEWLDVRGVTAGGGEDVRVARFQGADVPEGAPADVAAALAERSVYSQRARVAAGAPIGTTAIVEAAKSADVAVVEAWLLERGQPFSLDATTLVLLADAGVPPRITDAMVAVSNPKAFAFARAEDRRTRSDVIETEPARRVYVNMNPSYDPWGYGNSRYGYGYSPYGDGYGRYGGYGSGYYPPIIIVGSGRDTDGRVAQPRGRAVKGQGYTQTERASGSSQNTSPGGRGETSSGSSTGTSTPPAQSDNTQRTAKPRP